MTKAFVEYLVVALPDDGLDATTLLNGLTEDGWRIGWTCQTGQWWQIEGIKTGDLGIRVIMQRDTNWEMP